MNWISTDIELPEERKYVLARHNRETWHDSDDQFGVNFVVVKCIKGISKLEREKMKLNKVICKDYNVERWKIIKSGDEDGNNEKPYCWDTFGSTSFFGQEITHWMPIPK